MAKRTFQLTPKEIQGLWIAYEHAEKQDEQRRWQAVRLYGEGRPVQDIQAITGCSEPSLRRWARQYRQGGIDGLRSHWHGGNRARLKPEQRAHIQQVVGQSSPDQLLGKHQRRHTTPYWTVDDLKLLVERTYGVSWQSRTSYINLLHACGLSVQRVGVQYRSRPSAEVIAEAEAELEKK